MQTSTKRTDTVHELALYQYRTKPLGSYLGPEAVYQVLVSLAFYSVPLIGRHQPVTTRACWLGSHSSQSFLRHGELHPGVAEPVCMS